MCPTASARVVERLVAAGAIPMGKTNLDQFATGLNGTRSPYGAPACVFNRSYISGGSSSGSAVAVAAGLVSVRARHRHRRVGPGAGGHQRPDRAEADQGPVEHAGLGPRLPIARLRHRTGAAPSAMPVWWTGSWRGLDPGDPWSRRPADQARVFQRIGVPRRDQRLWFGDAAAERLYDQALARIEASGAELVEIDMAPLREAAQLLYEGTVGGRADHGGRRVSGRPSRLHRSGQSARSCRPDEPSAEREVFAGIYRLAELQRDAEALWERVDMLALPTTPTVYRIAEMRAAPLALNSNLGLYTNFVNLLDMAALALPAGFRDNGTGFGITLVGPAWTDLALLDAGEACFAGSPSAPAPPLDLEGHMETVKLAVVGAHLEGMPLHWQLTSRNARLVAATHTAPSYRLYAMANSVPPKPALVFADRWPRHRRRGLRTRRRRVRQLRRRGAGTAGDRHRHAGRWFPGQGFRRRAARADRGHRHHRTGRLAAYIASL